ncbi:hypothetical protein BGW42_003690 [Actinomortierella wolfii]|nr:hypothetical protein BGW42_003690 [Actinomortierella wolfii]
MADVMLGTTSTRNGTYRAIDTMTSTYAEGAEKVGEITQGVVDRVGQSTFVQRMIVTPTRFVLQKYNESPLFVKLSLATFAVLSAVPVACFLGFMGVVAVGLLVVGGLSFAIVEGGFGVFASLFLLPALGIALLVAGGVGLTALLVYASYAAISFGIGMFRGRGAQTEFENKAERMRLDADTRMTSSA